MSNDFKISRNGNTIALEKNNNRIFIGYYDDIWIEIPYDKEQVIIEINELTNNREEYLVFIALENLIKSILGRYVLNKDYNKKLSTLPKDFIDCKTSTITWHSEGCTDNILKLKYDDNKIEISITKKLDRVSNGSVIIRTFCSDYGYYYNEFIIFIRSLYTLTAKEEVKETIDNSKSKVSLKNILGRYLKRK